MFNRILIFAIGIFTSFCGTAQEVIVRGQFLNDSIQIGAPVSFYLTAQYPQKQTIVFPDSTYSFAPFEFIAKKVFTTQTTNHTSYDSVVYTLTTFETDSVQVLKIPIFVIQANDCTKVFSSADLVYLNKALKNIPYNTPIQELPLKTSTHYFNVSWLFNYPLLAIISIVVVIIFILCWLLFGKKIRKYFRAKRLVSNHQAFLLKFDQAVETLNPNFSSPKTEAAVLIWKEYLENLMDVPFTKYTTKEIMLYKKDDQLGQSLQVIDRMVYANQPGESRHFAHLKDFSNSQFNKKLEEIKNG